jgi:hypothetical protein
MSICVSKEDLKSKLRLDEIPAKADRISVLLNRLTQNDSASNMTWSLIAVYLTSLLTSGGLFYSGLGVGVKTFAFTALVASFIGIVFLLAFSFHQKGISSLLYAMLLDELKKKRS